MASFNKVKSKIQQIEGGYQNNPNDSGNYNSNNELVGTNYGITADTYEQVFGTVPSVEDMQALTVGQALDIYKNVYWNGIRGDEIQNQSIANILFDGFVNMGYNGVKLMQNTLNVYFNEHLAIDGIVGTMTLGAINARTSPQLHDAYKEARLQFYNQIVQNDPSQGVFLEGWTNRLNYFQYSSGSGGGMVLGIAALLLLFMYSK